VVETAGGVGSGLAISGRMPRHTLLAAILLSVAIAGLLMLTRERSPASPAMPASASVAAPVSPRVRQQLPPRLDPTAQPVDTREQVAAQIEREVAPLRTRQEVTAYLDELERRAEANGQVTALEVMPGVIAIEQLAGAIGFQRATELGAEFAERMAQLSARLDGRDQPPPAEDLNALLADIESAAADEVAPMVNRYVSAIAPLELDEQQSRMRQLHEISASPGDARQ